MSSKIHVGVIGAGSNTRCKHIPKLQEIDGVEVVAVCNRSRASAQKVCEEFGIAKAVESHEEIMSDTSIDAVVIGTWPHLHRDLSLAALEAGKHVMCEARMAMNSVESAEMLAVSRKHPDLVAQVVPAPFALKWHEIIMDKLPLLGELIGVSLCKSAGEFADFDTEQGNRQTRAISGNNIMGLGISYESISRWVGPAKRVFATGQTVVKQSGDGKINDVPDHINVLGDLEGGAELSMRISNVSGGHVEDHVYVFGTQGTLKVEGADILISTRAVPEWQSLKSDPLATTFWRVEREFIGAIRGEEQIRFTSFEDGHRYMCFIDAVQESLQSRQAVELAGT